MQCCAAGLQVKSRANELHLCSFSNQHFELAVSAMLHAFWAPLAPWAEALRRDSGVES